MNAVGTGAGNDVNDAAARIAILRGEIAGEEAELLDGIGIGERQAGIQIGIVVIGAIHLEIDLAAVGGASQAYAIDVRRLFGRVDAALSTDAATVAARIDRTDSQI